MACRATAGGQNAAPAFVPYLTIRLNNQPIYDPKQRILRALPKHTPKGLADILAVMAGRIAFIEVKG